MYSVICLGTTLLLDDIQVRAYVCQNVCKKWVFVRSA